MSCSIGYQLNNGYRLKEFNDSTFVRVFWHNSVIGNFFKGKEILFVNKRGRFSVVGSINEVFKENENYEFLLEYCQVSKHFHWQQKTNILEKVDNVNMTPKNISGGNFYGLSASYLETLTSIDGTPGNNTNWYYSIGQKTNYYGGIAGAYWFENEQAKYDTVSEEELWMKINSTKLLENLPSLINRCTHKMTTRMKIELFLLTLISS